MMDSSFTECFQWQKWLFSEQDFFILQLIFKKKIRLFSVHIVTWLQQVSKVTKRSLVSGKIFQAERRRRHIFGSQAGPSKLLTVEREEALRVYFMPLDLITYESQTEQCKQCTGCIMHYKSDPMILKQMEILVRLGAGRGMVSSEIGVVYITCLRKLLKGTATCFACFRGPGS